MSYIYMYYRWVENIHAKRESCVGVILFQQGYTPETLLLKCWNLFKHFTLFKKAKRKDNMCVVFYIRWMRVHFFFYSHFLYVQCTCGISNPYIVKRYWNGPWSMLRGRKKKFFHISFLKFFYWIGIYTHNQILVQCIMYEVIYFCTFCWYP